MEQASVRHRLEQRPRQLPLLLDLVGGGADLRDELPRGVQQRAAVGVQGGSSGLGAARDERGLLDVEVQAAVGERLIAEDEHGVFVHPASNLGEGLTIVNLAKIDLAHLGDEMLVKPSECQSHGHTFLLLSANAVAEDASVRTPRGIPHPTQSSSLG